MLRAIWFLIVLGGVTAASVWLANHPGSVSVQWQGYRVDTSFAVLTAAVSVIAVTAAVVYRFWVFLKRAPQAIGRARREGRRRRGYLALSRGMVAVAAGDVEGARRQVKRAEGLLGDPALTMLLSAQAAQLAGNENAAAGFFQAMLERPETEFLGLRGLLTQAIRQGHTDRAISLAQRAHKLRPKSDWVTETLFNLQTHSGQWADAERTMGRTLKLRLLPVREGSRRRAVLAHLRSLEASTLGETSHALKLARKANGFDPAFIPAAIRLAWLLLEAGQARKVGPMIQAAWGVRPHPDLVEPWLDARDAGDPLSRASQVEKLIAAQPDHVESHLAIARAALNARLWGKARKHLMDADGEAPSGRVCRLFAELEDSEHGDMDKARAWLVRASLAEPDPAWVCRQCGDAAKVWSALCPKCGRFDGLEWDTPPRITALATAGAATNVTPAGAATNGMPAGAINMVPIEAATNMISDGSEPPEGVDEDEPVKAIPGLTPSTLDRNLD